MGLLSVARKGTEEGDSGIRRLGGGALFAAGGPQVSVVIDWQVSGKGALPPIRVRRGKVDHQICSVLRKPPEKWDREGRRRSRIEVHLSSRGKRDK